LRLRSLDGGASAHSLKRKVKQHPLVEAADFSCCGAVAPIAMRPLKVLRSAQYVSTVRLCADNCVLLIVSVWNTVLGWLPWAKQRDIFPGPPSDQLVTQA